MKFIFLLFILFVYGCGKEEVTSSAVSLSCAFDDITKNGASYASRSTTYLCESSYVSNGDFHVAFFEDGSGVYVSPIFFTSGYPSAEWRLAFSWKLDGCTVIGYDDNGEVFRASNIHRLGSNTKMIALFTDLTDTRDSWPVSCSAITPSGYL